MSSADGPQRDAGLSALSRSQEEVSLSPVVSRDPTPGRRWRILTTPLAWLGLPAILVGTWWVVSEGSTDFFRPPLRLIVAAFGETWFSTRLTEDVLPSLGRLALGYLAALVIGTALGVAIGSNPWLRALTEPVLEFLRAIPPPVLIPVIMLVAGIGDLMKVIVIISGCVWPILLNTVEGVRGVDEVLADTCRSYRINPLRHLTLRATSPQIVTGARQALSIGIILMVISEMFAASSGLGFTIVQFQRGFQIPEMWSGVLVLGLIGVALSLLFRIAEGRVLFWYHAMRSTEREW
jgi:ABC-type nitrate/sulfonate/bicarbonate transport system permease component